MNNKRFPFEDCALRVLWENTADRVLKNAVVRVLGITPEFEVGDKVVLNYGDDFNGLFATIKRKTYTKDGTRYAVQIGEGCGYECEIEGFSGDDMELNDRAKLDEYNQLHTCKA